MTESTAETGAVSLYKHSARKDWGVAILVREDGGKRGYLFDDGAERTMASGYHQLMLRVERPNDEQIAFYEKQRARIERHEKASASTSAGGPSFLAQLERIHETYPAGLTDKKWAADIRGEGATERTPQHRDALIREAQEQLSAGALDGLMAAQNFGQVWSAITAVLGHTDVVPAAQLKKTKLMNQEGLRAIATAARELLHGKGAYEPRLDAYLAALTLIHGEAPHWEIATALSAAFFPKEHVAVHPTAFRQQLKGLGSRGAAPARATTAAYMRFLGIARVVSTKLTEQGQPPRDLFDVYDFIRVTLGPAPRARARSTRARRATKSTGDDADSGESES